MPKETKNTQKRRAQGMTQISISLPQSLVEKIDRMADAESRNRSNYIATVMKLMPEKEKTNS